MALPRYRLVWPARPSVWWLPCLALCLWPGFSQGYSFAAVKAVTRKGQDPKILTSKIKRAGTPADLWRVLDGAVDNRIFNEIHATTACGKLARWRSRADLQSPVSQRLAKRMQYLIEAGHFSPGGLAKGFWACAKLFLAIPAILIAVPSLVKAASYQAKDMNAQELSNSLWAAAQLKNTRTEVLEAVRAIVTQIPGKAMDMNTQDMSNNLGSAAKLQDTVPEVLQIVSSIAAVTPGKVVAMKEQELSNSLYAAAQLQDAAPEVLEVVPPVAAQIPGHVGQMTPQALSNCLSAAMRLQEAVPEVLVAVPALAREAVRKVDSMNSLDLAECLTALVVLENCIPILELPTFAVAAGQRLRHILPDLRGNKLFLDVPMAVWACAKADACDADLLPAVAELFSSKTFQFQSLPQWNLCALAWAYRTLDDDGTFANLLDRLESEISRRGLREEEVLANGR